MRLMLQANLQLPCLSTSPRETSVPCVQICAPSALSTPPEGGEKTTAELREENAALRRELARLKGVQPDEVQCG